MTLFFTLIHQSFYISPLHFSFHLPSFLPSLHFTSLPHTHSIKLLHSLSLSSISTDGNPPSNTPSPLPPPPQPPRSHLCQLPPSQKLRSRLHNVRHVPAVQPTHLLSAASVTTSAVTTTSRHHRRLSSAACATFHRRRRWQRELLLLFSASAFPTFVCLSSTVHRRRRWRRWWRILLCAAVSLWARTTSSESNCPVFSFLLSYPTSWKLRFYPWSKFYIFFDFVSLTILLLPINRNIIINKKG